MEILAKLESRIGFTWLGYVKKNYDFGKKTMMAKIKNKKTKKPLIKVAFI